MKAAEGRLIRQFAIRGMLQYYTLPESNIIKGSYNHLSKRRCNHIMNINTSQTRIIMPYAIHSTKPPDTPFRFSIHSWMLKNRSHFSFFRFLCLFVHTVKGKTIKRKSNFVFPSRRASGLRNLAISSSGFLSKMAYLWRHI